MNSIPRVCKDCNTTFIGSRHRCEQCHKNRYPWDRTVNIPPNKQADNYALNLRTNRNSRYKRYYGISLDEREAMLAQQGHKCKICRVSLVTISRNTHIDHCHKTGKVRGILCSQCNKALGLFKDDPHLVGKALMYLIEHGYKKSIE